MTLSAFTKKLPVAQDIYCCCRAVHDSLHSGSVMAVCCSEPTAPEGSGLPVFLVSHTNRNELTVLGIF